jgi:putative ABC transport system substrate-binding protein
MRRREFITLVGGGIAAWSLAARAHEPSDRMRRVGVLVGIANDPEGQIRVMAFQQRLREFGWVEGQNVRIDLRWAAADLDRIRTYASELVDLAPDVIVGTSSPVTMALQEATKSVPIVFTVVNDAIGRELVTNVARPRSNITGITNFESSMGGKWVEILKEIAPRTARAGLLFDSANSANLRRFYAPSIDVVGRSLGVELTDAPVHDTAQIECALDDLAREPNVGVVVLPDNTTVRHRELIIALTARHGLPAVYPYRFFATNGGLVSYGVDTVDSYRRAASYVDRILRGAKPADLPLEQPHKFELIINLKSAKTLGLDVPVTLLARANEVRE